MRLRSHRTCLTCLVLLTLAPNVARATVTIDVQVPGITGEDNPPGFAGSMRTQVLDVAPHDFAITKLVDSASTPITLAIVGGSDHGTSRALLYNGTTATGTPAAVIPFAHTVASAYQSLGGNPATEKDTFASTVPALMYLEIPGITGPASTPGHTGLLPVETFSIESGDFTVTRLTDSASQAVAQAVVLGTNFPTATMLFYDTSPAGAAPDSTLVLHTVSATSDQTFNEPGGVLPHERATFDFNTATPEPAAGAMLFLVAAAGAFTRRRS